MRVFSLTLLLVALLAASCSEDQPNAVIKEPAGSAQYVIGNQSNSDLRVIFTKSRELNSEVDTSEVIESMTSAMIFKDGIIGENPKPSDSFSKIEFYEASDFSSPVYVFEPVDDEQWRIVSQDPGVSGYGLTIYEFSLTGDQLK